LAQTSTALASSSEVVAEGTAKQSSAAAAVASNVQEIAASIGSISDSAQAVRETSHLSLSNTEEGGTSLAQLQQEIESVKKGFAAINSSVGDFVSNTEAITAMTKQVKDLADQTNLLALNAAIEAARAGEQGRGFAVVADEVRKLAEKSARAANEIELVTSRLASQSTSVDEALSACTKSLQTSVANLDQLQKVFDHAKDAVIAADRGIDDIAGGVREHSNNSNDIARHIEEIAAMAERNTTAVTQSNQSMRTLVELSEQLQSSVAHFRA
jgi:methyl-accepting chemotaxis protein